MENMVGNWRADQPLYRGMVRDGLLAWGARDERTNTLPVHRGDGSLWFIIDLATGQELIEPPPLPEPDVSHEEWVASLHRLADEERTECKCYFIGAGRGRIKIGYSSNPEARMAAFQAGSPVRLQILALAPGGMAREVAYHAQFQAHRAYGEWFARAPEIVAEIERLKA